ncbi:MAG: hypothetical protein H0T42_27675 [Deltaproteobacteria bacterium]|nr:hypothetical protein [Deltaproteobacteria bacterium]
MLAGGLYERTSGMAGQPLGSYRRRAPERTGYTSSSPVMRRRCSPRCATPTPTAVGCRERRPTASPGMMTRAEVARRYLARSGRSTDVIVFFYAFGLLKTAVIAQQIYYRFAKGLTTDPRFATIGLAVRLLAEQARTAIDRGAI